MIFVQFLSDLPIPPFPQPNRFLFNCEKIREIRVKFENCRDSEISEQLKQEKMIFFCIHLW